MAKITTDNLEDYRYRIVVFGSRSYNNYNEFSGFIKDMVHALEVDLKEILFISGKAWKGADNMIIQWCREYDVDWKEYPANWDDLEAEGAVIRTNRQGKQYNAIAGHQRNQAMAEISNLAWGFYDNKSPGTRDMIARCERLKLNTKVILVHPDGVEHDPQTRS